MTNPETIRIFCTNKNDSTDSYATDLATDWTIGEITAALVADGFLPDTNWLVHHSGTGRQLMPNTTLAAADVEDGGQLTFHPDTVGAVA